jgi:excisionase family DNA binding protein
MNKREFDMEPWVFSIVQACEAACIGRTALYEAINAGQLIAHKRGKRTLILAEDLQRWIKSLPPMKIKRAQEDGVHPNAVASKINDQKSNATTTLRRAA